jgi:hypothetical protein
VVNLTDEAPLIVDALNEFLDSRPDLLEMSEALIYGLAQVMQDKVEASGLKDEERGCAVSNIMSALKELNRNELVLYYERLRLLVEQKSSTTH